MALRGLPLALLVLTLLVSGCTGPDEVPDLSSGGDPGPGGASGADPSSGHMLLRPTPQAYKTTVWANGSFAPTQACNTGGCLTGDFQHMVDLAPHIPADLPTRLAVVLEYERDATVSFAFPRVFVVAEEGTIYRQTITDGSNRQQVDVILNAAAAVSLVVEAYWPRYTDTETAYTLSATISVSNETVPAAVPTAVALSEGQWLQVHAEDDVAFAAIYGPDDVLQGRYMPEEGIVSFKAETAGEHIVFAGPAGSVRFTTNGTETELHALHIARTFAEPRTPEADGPTEWTFEADQGLIGAGVYLRTTATHGAFLHTLPEDLTLTGPQGAVIDGTYDCVCVSIVPGAYVSVFEATAGHPGLVAGTYTGRYDWSGSVGLEVGHLTAGYVR